MPPLFQRSSFVLALSFILTNMAEGMEVDTVPVVRDKKRFEVKKVDGFDVASSDCRFIVCLFDIIERVQTEVCHVLLV